MRFTLIHLTSLLALSSAIALPQPQLGGLGGGLLGGGEGGEGGEGGQGGQQGGEGGQGGQQGGEGGLYYGQQGGGQPGGEQQGQQESQYGQQGGQQEDQQESQYGQQGGQGEQGGQGQQGGHGQHGGQGQHGHGHGHSQGQGGICGSSSPLCCQVGLLGVTNCASAGAVTTPGAFNAQCAQNGLTAQCCILPLGGLGNLGGDGLVCTALLLLGLGII